jgi:hypothetical protein
MPTDETPRKYLYAIAAAEALDEALDGEGLGEQSGLKDQPVHVVEADALAILASDLDEAGEVRPRRRNLKAHHGVIGTLVDQAVDVLPVSFGVLAEGEERLRRFLTAHEDRLQTQLDAVAGCVEVGVTVSWTVDDIFQYFVDQYEELREARDDYFAGGDREPTREEKIHLGELFKNALEAERNAHRATVKGTLVEACRRIQEDDCRDQEEVMRLACLVPRDDVDALETAIQAAAEDFDDHFLFEYTDPMAPYSFTDLEL